MRLFNRSPLPSTRNSFSAILLLLAILVAPAAAEDWTQWRGNRRDGVWRETGILEKFPAKELTPKWRQPIGSGYTGPTVADGRVFVMDRLIEPSQQERVLCFDEKSGKKLWTVSYDCPYRNVSYEAGPRASVTVDGDRAYALGTMGDLYCLSVTGEKHWYRDLDEDYNIRMPIWGIAAAPLVFEDLLIVHIGGEDGASIVALDKMTGEERWRALDDNASYVAPIIIEQAGKPVLVQWTGERVVGLDPKSGSLHWAVPFEPVQMVIGIATPVLHRESLFVTSFFDGSLRIDLAKDALSAKQAWMRRGESEKQTDALHSIIGTPFLRGDYIYGVDSYGELRCLNFANGDRVWEDLSAVPKNRWATIHFVEHEPTGNIWMFNDVGELIIAKLDPKGFHEIDRAKLISPTRDQLPSRRGGVAWSHPAFANKHIFQRNDEELICVDLSAK